MEETELFEAFKDMIEQYNKSHRNNYIILKDGIYFSKLKGVKPIITRNKRVDLVFTATLSSGDYFDAHFVLSSKSMKGFITQFSELLKMFELRPLSTYDLSNFESFMERVQELIGREVCIEFITYDNKFQSPSFVINKEIINN